MSETAELAMRWRVRLGYLLVFFYAWLARPSILSILIGSVIAAVGLLIRAAAAGHLRKHEALATSGPYASTRNPLYFGSALMAAGMIAAAQSWILLALIGAYFAFFYSMVMRREEKELRERYAAAFDEYASRVPLFFPRFSRAKSAAELEPSPFSWKQYMRNREWQAAAGTLLVIFFLWLKWRYF
jgi:protein-S-isoprenylcysteine O-methyltransferase Ste14